MSGLTRDQLTTLRAVCDAATQGQYERLVGDYGRRVAASGTVICRVESPDPQHHRDAAYLATFSPPTIRRLLAAAERLLAIQEALDARGAQI